MADDGEPRVRACPTGDRSAKQAGMTSTPKGTCGNCQQVLTKGGMTRHLKTCLGPGDHLLLAISAPGGPWWMDVVVAPQATLAGLDRLLRQTWLECCGHLSAFQVGDQSFEGVQDDGWDDWGGRRRPRSMDVKVATALRSADRFTYEYDFGSTTRLVGRVVGRVGGGRDHVVIVARNEPPSWACSACGEPADVICACCGALSCGCAAVTDEDDDYGECAECGQSLEEMGLPVVNSPRMGVCGYTGDM